MGEKSCGECGHPASRDARFCEHCGTALVPGAEPLRAPDSLEAKILRERTGIEGERKQVTVMYTDIVGSMGLTRALDNERWGFVLDRFLALAAGAVHSFEGTVNQFTGDGLLAVFGAPLAHEDHARRACLAVLELQAKAAELGAEVSQRDGVDFSVRCGLNSGEVVVGEIGDDVHMDFVPIGNTTALGKRIESLAPPGSTAISASTAALVEGEFELRELGEFDVKGGDRPQRVLELAGPGPARTRLEATAATRGLSPFVGRDAERAELDAALAEAEEGRGAVIGVAGDPGVGKSRLVREFVAGCEARGVRVNVIGGVPHGRYVPFLPVLVLYRDYFGIAESDPPEVARERIESAMLALDPAFADDLPVLFEFLGVPDPERPLAPMPPGASQSRLLDLMTRSVHASGRRGPAVTVFEDLHWIDDASAQFLEELAGAVVGSRTMVVATFRPEYDAAWITGGGHTVLSLDPLEPAATNELLGGLLGSDPSLDGLPALIEERTGGNPFFIEEIIQALDENGLLAGSRGDYRLAAELDRLVLPATVQAGLAARIDRLPSREKELVQTMAVIGAEIPEPLLGEVSELGRPQLAEAVAELASAQMVLPQGSSAGLGYVFKHPLTQDVAYGSQLSEQRARIHTRVAAAIERTYPDGLDEQAALLAHHCEASGDELKAAGWHARAAAWAQLSSPGEGMRHWRRVSDLASRLPASPQRDELAAEAQMGVLRHSWRIGASPEETAVIRDELSAGIERARTDPNYCGFLIHSGREREGLAGFREISRRAVADADLGLVVTVCNGVSYASWLAGSLSEGFEASTLAVKLAGGDSTIGSGLAFICPLAHVYGGGAQCRGYLGELEEARQDFDHAVAMAREHGDSETEAAAHGNRAQLEVDLGNFGDGISHAARGLELAERAGNEIHALACRVPIAVADAGRGQWSGALAQAEADLGTIREREIGMYFEPLLLATIGRSKLALGDSGGALAAAEEGVRIMESRRLGTVALQAPLALAEVLRATRGSEAQLRIDSVLAQGRRVAEAAGARVFADRLQPSRFG